MKESLSKIDKSSTAPLYFQLAELLKNKIESGVIANGDKLLSESEMIEKYKVGRMTVRNALSVLVNSGYLAKEQGKGTFCVYSPGTTKKDTQKYAHTIDVILNLDDGYFIHYYVKSISSVLSAHGYEFVINDSKNDSKHICNLLENIAHKGSAGVIVQPSHFIDYPVEEVKRAFAVLRRQNIPFVMINDVYDCVENASYLKPDEYAGGAAAAAHLIELGHERVGVVYIDSFRVFLSRCEGFKDVYAKKGLKTPFIIPPYNANNFVKELVGSIIREKLTAIFCTSDDLAKSCAEYLKSIGILIPQDFSLLGYDDSLVAEVMDPRLTSVAHPKHILGEMAAHTLINMIKDENYKTSFVHVLTPSLTIGGSTARLGEE